MALYVAIFADAGHGEVRTMSWGAWGVHSVAHAEELATDTNVSDPATDHLLVLAHPKAIAAVNIVAATVAAVRPELPLAVIAKPGTRASFVHTMGYTEGLDQPTAVGATVVAALESTVVGAWVPSVAKLSDPNPSLGQHLKSMVARGEGYLAMRTPDDEAGGWVEQLPVNQVAAQRRLHNGPSSENALVGTMLGELPESAIKALMMLGLRERPRRGEPSPGADEEWGSEMAIEFIIAPPVGRFVLSPATGACPCCSLPLWANSCPFCHAKAQPNVAQGVVE